jgi:hypothetical protein
LQDVDANANQVSDVWDAWDVTWRDVIIVDGQNETVNVVNLTSNDLGVDANYATLRDKLLDAAMAEQKPWQNHRDRFDINDDGFVVPGDVLIMINEINANGPLELPPPTGTTLAAPYWDANGDNFFSPIDILQVINYFEEADAEGEAATTSDTMFSFVAGEFANEPSQPQRNDIAIQAVDAFHETADSPMPFENLTLLETAITNRVQPTEPIEDYFWAGYWPGL